ncbi:MAG: hypothetical protein CM15mP23_09710 [Cryomorphaceae bacterium]|nr:MAG: hypothetical protein CM15mP23_09710 [Cryomorphaceae bacterium]
MFGLAIKPRYTKPFMLLYQFKAPHRDWRPDSMYHELFSDFDFPLPETFNDDYEGRLAASENMMEIGNHSTEET